MGLKKYLRGLLPHRRDSANHAGSISTWVNTTENGSPTPSPPLRRRTIEFFTSQARSAARHVLVKLNIVEPAEDCGEVLVYQPSSSPVTQPSPQHQKDFSTRYIEIKLIAAGGNGKVHLCRDTRIGTLVAAKTIFREHGGIPNEVRILEEVGEHENIVRYHEFLNDALHPRHTKIIFEYCEMGDLADYIERPEFNDGIPEMLIWNVVAQLSKGLHHIHRTGIVHGDLKLSNVILIAPENGETWPTLKIADFGTSVEHPWRMIPRAHLGTWGCLPPESNKSFGTEVDIWGLGVIIHILAIGREPIIKIDMPEQDIDEWFYQHEKFVPPGTPCPEDYKMYCCWHAQRPCYPRRIDERRMHGLLGVEARYSKLLNYFMMRCLDMDWKTRISAFELHRFVPTLENFVLGTMTEGHEDLLERFDDGRDVMWLQVRDMSDSEVVKQMYFAISDRARRWAIPRMMLLVKELPKIMDAKDYADACRRTGGSLEVQTLV